MNQNENPPDVTTPVETESGTRMQEEVELVDLGRASERTRGSYTGFITEASSFPLYQ